MAAHGAHAKRGNVGRVFLKATASQEQGQERHRQDANGLGKFSSFDAAGKHCQPAGSFDAAGKHCQPASGKPYFRGRTGEAQDQEGITFHAGKSKQQRGASQVISEGQWASKWHGQ